MTLNWQERRTDTSNIARILHDKGTCEVKDNSKYSRRKSKGKTSNNQLLTWCELNFWFDTRAKVLRHTIDALGKLFPVYEGAATPTFRDNLASQFTRDFRVLAQLLCAALIDEQLTNLCQRQYDTQTAALLFVTVHVSSHVLNTKLPGFTKSTLSVPRFYLSDVVGTKLTLLRLGFFESHLPPPMRSLGWKRVFSLCISYFRHELETIASHLIRGGSI